jgi:hypothetical protein
MKILFIILITTTSFMYNSKVKADVPIICLNCSEIQAETKVLFEARNRANSASIYTERFVIFDPVINLTRTYKALIHFEAELGRNVIEAISSVSNETQYVEAVNAYNYALVSFYNQLNSIQDPGALFEIYDSVNDDTTQAAKTSVDVNGWLYNIIRGQAIYNVAHPSYSWMQNSLSNQLKVTEDLSLMFTLDALSGSLSTIGKQAFAELILQMPLQYTVRFENGDTVTFFFDCLCSIPFLPLHETAQNSSGQKISSTSQSSGSAGYGGFYNATIRNGQQLRRVCTTVYTGSAGNLTPQKVCWSSYF